MVEALSKTSGGGGFNKIRVVIRVRPFLEGEGSQDAQAINASIKYREETNEIE